jgi:nitrile hydratase accessory protein
VFGLTLALHEGGRFAWDEFRARLIREIARAEREPRPEGAPFPYYECWLHALEDLLDAKRLASPAAVAARASALAALPAGHDH